MPAGDSGFQQIPVLVILLQTFFIKPSRPHAVRPYFGPQTGFVLAFGKNTVRRDHVDSHPVLRQLDACNSPQLMTRRFSRTVRAKPGAGAGHVLGRDNDDVTSRALQDEMVGDFTERQKRAFHVHFFELAKGFEVDVFQVGNQRDAGVNHYNIDSAPGQNGPFETSGDRILVRDVDSDSHHALTGHFSQVGGETIKLFTRKIRGGQVTALFQQPAANAVADGPRGTRYQGNSVRKRQIGLLLFAVNVKNSQATKADNFRFCVVPC